MGHTYSNLVYHVVFSTSDRRDLIGPVIWDRLPAYMGGLVRDRGGRLLAMNGTANHVHLLAVLVPKLAVSEVVGQIKALSTAWIKGVWSSQRLFAWQEGFAVFSVGTANVDEVRRYIESKAAHHRKASFEEELVSMLKRAGIEYDPRYVFD